MAMPDDNLARATQEIYKQNVALAVTNKTLSILRALDTIAISSLEPGQVAQAMVDTIVSELKFSAAFISLVDEPANVLKLTAITQSPSIQESLQLIGRPLDAISVSLDYSHNLLITSLSTRTRQTTSNLLDILDPLATQEIADSIAQITQIKTVIIHPLVLGPKAIGVLAIGLPKKVDDLSRAEKEILAQLMSVVAVALDRARLHEDLTLANQRLIELGKLKDEFVYFASHELRSPMTAIKSYVWMVLNDKAGSLTEVARKYLNIVYASTERLIKLVNDMLNLSRIESGKIKLEPETFDISQIVSVVKEEFLTKAAEKGLRLEVQADQNLPQITADKGKIIQVLENLVSNAIKFTDSGQVSISIFKRPDYLEVSISDTGRGIAQTDLHRLFTKFGRLDTGLVKSAESGTGLGLYISQQFIQLHGGQISAASKIGQGSTFTFTLPLV